MTAFAPKLEAARPEDRPALIDAMLAVIAYHRVGDRPGRWEPRATKRRPKPGARLNQTTSRGQAAGESLEMVLKLVPFAGSAEAASVSLLAEVAPGSRTDASNIEVHGSTRVLHPGGPTAIPSDVDSSTLAEG